MIVIIIEENDGDSGWPLTLLILKVLLSKNDGFLVKQWILVTQKPNAL